jgi:LmbE family N-acetylglucosaminyl deacetylase
MRILLSFVATLMAVGSITALEPLPSGRLELELRKLDTLVSVLYVAAHPDDENTKLLAYLANGALAKTTYISLTRGDGGQNLLGTDLSEKLGIIRTHELLAARRIDGGEQRFTRANDFGYSKTPEETLRIWGKDAILADLVWTIRVTRPDVMIARFSVEPGNTHGHHTASAWLAKEAFAAAGDSQRFPEQLKLVAPWTPKRLLWNTSSWFYRSRNVAFDPTGLLAVDTGGYNPLLGASYSEIAARSRSSHKTQGFGATPELGESLEYFSHLEGEPATNSLFQNIDTAWSRVPNSKKVSAAIQRAIHEFVADEPWRAVPALIEAHRELATLPASFWRDEKLKSIANVIAGCLALDIESLSDSASAAPGASAALTVNAIQRSPLKVEARFRIAGKDFGPEKPVRLDFNKLQTVKQPFVIPTDASISQPYWLREFDTPGRYVVSDAAMIGTPENPPAIPVTAVINIEGSEFNFLISTTYNYNDPVRGEVKEPFVITPPVMVSLTESIQILGNSEPRPITARVLSKSANAEGTVHFTASNGWKVEPAEIPITLTSNGEELVLKASLIPPKIAGDGVLRAEVELNGVRYNRGFERITYEHIPVQTIFPTAEARLVLLDVKTAGKLIGYIPGAGDAIPEALKRIGYAVETLTEADLSEANLQKFDAIVLGIRALNTIDRIDFYMPALFKYAKAGGTVVLQYNTSRGLKTKHFSPLPLTLSQERVTDENAEVRLLAPDHPVLHFPNQINPADFSGWVQERGLYFADSWDDAFVPILSANDAGEPPRNGGLLIARYGEGWFVYSGLSWFRQLPAGVPGAYRLFANIVSLRHSK